MWWWWGSGEIFGNSVDIYFFWLEGDVFLSFCCTRGVRTPDQKIEVFHTKSCIFLLVSC